MKKILIVDDSPTIRRMVAASLQSLDSVVFNEASNGLEAIEILARESTNLMILDLNMPDMHGLDVLKFVRRQPQHQNLPIIVLTTRGDESSRQSAEQAGATTYLTKPFSPQVLAAAARTLLVAAGNSLNQV